MKIALLTPTFFQYSGIDRVVKQQAAEFAQGGDTVTIFTFEADLESPQNVELQLLGTPRNSFWQRVYRLSFPLDIVKTVKWLPKLKNFDIVYSHQYPMNWLAYLAKRFYRIRYIYYNHGIASPVTFSNVIEGIYMRILSRLTNWTARRADGAISVSQHLQQQLEQETGLISEIVYNKIDTTRFYEGLDSSRIRDKYGLGSSPLILYVGRISPHKGVHLLIEAFNLVRQEISEARLLIVGKHTFLGYSKKLRYMANDSISFTGYITDEEIPYYFAACSVYATATLWEGFNLPLVEAQACGKPVVAFNIGPHPEVVKESETGFLVPPGDTIALAKAIIRLLRDSRLRHQMGKNAVKMVKEKFSRGSIE